MESVTSGTITGAGSFRCNDCGYTLTLAGDDVLSDCPYCGGREFVRASLFTRATGLARGRMGRGAIGAMAGTRTGAGLGSGTDMGDAEAEAIASAIDEIPRTGGRILARRAGAGRQAGEADTIRQGAVEGILAKSEPIDGEDWLARVRERLQGREEPGEYLAYEEGGELRTVALTREWTRIGRSLAADVRFDDPTVSRRHALVVRQADGVRVLDDRSLNGVFVNGSRIDRSGTGQQTLHDGDEILVGRYRLRFLSIAVADRDSPPPGA